MREICEKRSKAKVCVWVYGDFLIVIHKWASSFIWLWWWCDAMNNEMQHKVLDLSCSNPSR